MPSILDICYRDFQYVVAEITWAGFFTRRAQLESYGSLIQQESSVQSNEAGLETGIFMESSSIHSN